LSNGKYAEEFDELAMEASHCLSKSLCDHITSSQILEVEKEKPLKEQIKE
jgi:hypothetical protein